MKMTVERAKELGLRICQEDCEICVCYIADTNICDESGRAIEDMITERIGCPLINEGRLKEEMTEEEYDAYRHNRLEICTTVAYDIQWDVDDEEDLEDIPDEIEIPSGMTDEEEISDYISEITGFCHGGFDLKEVRL